MVWALWSSRTDMYSQPELIGLFADEAVAEAVRGGLIGKRRYRMMTNLVWEDDEDFPDLYVQPVVVR
jgi:hypothetical protein